MTLTALTALADRDPVVPALADLLDPTRLADALGADVRPTWVRYKPGASVVVAFDTARGTCWAAAYGSDDKPAKAVARAGAQVRRIPGLAHAVTGSAFDDQGLERALAGLRRDEPALFDRGRMLRYNPHRRIVWDDGDDVVKVTAAPVARVVAASERLRARGVPVLAAHERSKRAWSAPRWGEGDLAERRSADAAFDAGVALAVLHGVTPRAADPAPASDAHAAAHAAARSVGELVPALAARARRLADAAPAERGGAFVHGDFSVDQVLVGDGVRLIDLDRAGAGEPERDLGSLLADERLRGVDDELAAAVLEGYAATGGDFDPDRVRRWTSTGMLLRAAEPFRRMDADWPSRIARAIALAEAA